MNPFTWTGPFRIADLLARCLDDDHPWPPPDKAVYLISQRPWANQPTADCAPLYVGGTTGRSARFCTRIGDLIADMHGFWDSRAIGHHSGGQNLYGWCKDHGVHPGELFIAWGQRTRWCGRCAETDLVTAIVGRWSQRRMVGLLNASRPPRCEHHHRRRVE